ncbi:hypothetical protein ABR737_14525 [Streptomyces sp. Edi2]|uniref:hypothetical protein n=1 Tax=Streptomyces sp. Edi2 TaxID=3162528 RepID=UPI0033057FAB
MKKPLTSAVLAGATVALAFTSVAVTAPTASAVGSSACTRNDANRNYNMSIYTPIHASPSGSSKVIAGGANDFTVKCSKSGHDGHRWWYGYISTGKQGWVWGANLQS